MQKLTFEFTLDEINLVLESLGEQPFNKVYALVNNIQQQAAAQMNASAQEGQAKNGQENGEPISLVK